MLKNRELYAILTLMVKKSSDKEQNEQGKSKFILRLWRTYFPL